MASKTFGVGRKSSATEDTGTEDAGAEDAGTKVAGRKDAGNGDAGRKDAGNGDAGAKGKAPRKPRPTVWEQTGGAVGLFISSFPVTVFSLVNTRYGLIPGISSALGTAVAFGILRFLRKQTIRPAVSAFIGISISSSVAFATGTAKGYFLFDIWFYLACLTITISTLIIRRPLAGLLWSSMNRSGGLWRKDKASLFGYDIATVAWAMVFGARFVVQHWLYDRNLTGWLAFAKIMMGFPLTIAAFTAVVWAVRRSEKRLRILDAEAAAAEEAAEAAAGPADTATAAATETATANGSGTANGPGTGRATATGEGPEDALPAPESELASGPGPSPGPESGHAPEPEPVQQRTVHPGKAEKPASPARDTPLLNPASVPGEVG